MKEKHREKDTVHVGVTASTALCHSRRKRHASIAAEEQFFPKWKPVMISRKGLK